MAIQTFISALAEEFQEEHLTPAMEFRSLDAWSSMQALLLIARVNEDFEVVLSEDDLRNCKTIEDLFQCVQNYQS